MKRTAKSLALLFAATIASGPPVSAQSDSTGLSRGDSSASAAVRRDTVAFLWVDSIRRALFSTSMDSVERAANRRYRVGIGASFDFLNGLSATDLYGDVTIRIPDLLVRGDGGRFSFGFDAGLHNGRASFAENENLITNAVYRDRVPHDDSMTVVTQTVLRVSNTHRDHLTLYGAPTLKLAPSIFGVFHAEVSRREGVDVIQFEITELDSVVAVLDTVGRESERFIEEHEDIRRTHSYGAFFGVGPLLDHDDADYNVWHKTAIGVEAVEGKFEWGYVVQFRFTDYDHGFKLGAEIRGSLDFNEPSVAVFLARDLSIGSLADFLVGGSGDNDPEPEN